MLRNSGWNNLFAPLLQQHSVLVGITLASSVCLQCFFFFLAYWYILFLPVHIVLIISAVCLYHVNRYSCLYLFPDQIIYLTLGLNYYCETACLTLLNLLLVLLEKVMSCHCGFMVGCSSICDTHLRGKDYNNTGLFGQTKSRRTKE